MASHRPNTASATRASVAIVANGFAEGPAQALRDFLADRGADVMTILHPLTPEQGRRHLVVSYKGGRRVRERAIHVPLAPPLSYAIDPLVPLLPPRVDTWFGFNPLACARGLVARKQGRTRAVVLWSVDFVPDRFGAGTLMTRIYDRLDRLSALHADARVELSEAARDARDARHELEPGATPTHVVPMGAWLQRVPTTPSEGFASRRVVFLGHLVPRQGVEMLLHALALLAARGEPVSADIVGGGPLEAELRTQTGELGLDDLVRFHGFLQDHREVERVLAQAAVGVALYRTEAENFTRFADPGKLKAYLAAGLPIVLTDVPPNALELAREGGAEIVDENAEAIAAALSRAIAPEQWSARRLAALAYVRRFDWATLLPEVLGKLGIRVPTAEAGEADDESGEISGLARDHPKRLEQADGD